MAMRAGRRSAHADGLVLFALFTGSLFGLALYFGMGFLASLLAALNLGAFFLFGYDKRVAGTGMTRVPEVVLYAAILLGGSVGGIAGMRFFRHKTARAHFQLVVILILLLQIMVLFALTDGFARPILFPQLTASSSNG